MQEYNSIKLGESEVEFLLELTQLTGEPVKAIPFPEDIDIAMEEHPFDASTTFWYKDNHIIGLIFLDSELESLPKNIGNLSYIRYLIIISCKIQNIPPTLKKLNKLELIEFNNEAEDEKQPIINIDFPDIFKDLSNLEIFKINGHFNIYFPPSFTELHNIKEIQLKYCTYSPNHSNYIKNSKLDFKDPESWDKTIYEFPEDLGKINSLEKLILVNSRIKKLPESLKILKSLLEIEFEKTREINNLEIVFDIKSLEKLKLTHCEIKSLPKTISNLKNLKELNLSWNNLQELPFEITNCKQLERIDLYMNGFDKLLECLKYLPNLKHIVIHKHRQDAIPKELYKKIEIELV